MFTLKKIAVIVGLLVFLVGCGEDDTKKSIVKEVKLIAVNVHTLKKEAYPIWVDFSGKTQAVDEVIVTSRVTGELKESLFTPGDTVKKGQILFRIDKSEYQAVWDQKNAILEKDKASLTLANANVNRYEPLVKEQLAPREKLDELIATKQQLEATIRADKAALDAAELNLKYCDVKASIDGQIGKELVLLGNIVNVGTELAKIVQTDNLYVNINPSAHEVTLIKKYRSEDKPKVKVLLQSNKRMNVEFEGEIDFIDNVSSSSTGTVEMRAKIFNQDRLLFPGTFVTVKLFLSDKFIVLAVHPDQISQNQLGEFVYVVNAQNQIEVRQIKTNYSNNELVIIREGLQENDKVVVGTVSALRDGLKVSSTEVDNPITK